MVIVPFTKQLQGGQPSDSRRQTFIIAFHYGQEIVEEDKSCLVSVSTLLIASNCRCSRSGVGCKQHTLLRRKHAWRDEGQHMGQIGLGCRGAQVSRQGGHPAALRRTLESDVFVIVVDVLRQRQDDVDQLEFAALHGWPGQ